MRPCLFVRREDIELNILRIADAFKEQPSGVSVPLLPLLVGMISALNAAFGPPFPFHVLDLLMLSLLCRGKMGPLSVSGVVGLPLDTFRKLFS